MMKPRYVLYFLGLIFLFTNCRNDLIEKVVDINSIDTSGIYFKYIYQDSVYDGHFSLYVTDEDFSYVDDLRIRIDGKSPENYYFVSVIKKEWDTEDALVNLDTENDTSYYSYHDVDIKPIFETAKDEFENDSALLLYFMKNLDNLDNIELIGAYILIDGNGRPRLKKAVTNDLNKIKTVKEHINNMPYFTPAYYDSDTVTVVYLIEIPIPARSDL